VTSIDHHRVVAREVMVMLRGSTAGRVDPLMTGFDPSETSLHCSKYPSFDHLVSTDKQRWWDREAERLRGFEVDS